jgi:DNA mismatch repair protein MutH
VLPYNPNSKKSIIEFATRLKGESLRTACDKSILTHNYGGKGNFGQLLEKFYFKYKPNSDALPDFPIAGLELKSTPLKKLKKNEYRSKERLVLNVINYLDIAEQNFESSSFWKKNANILLVIYLHNRDQNVLDYLITLVDEWIFPEVDLQIIRRDWALIKNKIVAGNAHELSEGDTLYLGACTKGNAGGNLRPQPKSLIKAKQRAFSLKQGYVNHIIASISNNISGNYGKLIPNASIAKAKTLEEIVLLKFKPYFNKTEKEIVKSIGVKLNVKSKNYYSSLAKAILGVDINKEIEEFVKADIEIKTVRLKENNLPKEDISFPVFNYEELVIEKWDNSNFKAILESKFLFVFFQFENRKVVLREVKFWNMPYQDVQEAKKVWVKTKKIVLAGDIVKEVKQNRRLTNFPSKKFSSVAHVRPHTSNSLNTLPIPTKDKVTKKLEYTKHSFWLNNSYIRDEIYLKRN